MAEIDVYLEVLFRESADRLSLASGQPVLLAVNGEERAVTEGPVPRARVEGLLSAILPGGGPAAPGRHEFEHETPAGRVGVRAYVTESAVRVLMTPLLGREQEPGGNGGSRGVPGEPGSAEKPAGATGREEMPTEGTPAVPPDPRAVEGPAVELRPGAPAIERLLRRLVEAGGSDLHLSSENVPLFRRDGEIVDLGGETELSAQDARALLWEITPPEKREEFERRHDADFAYEIPGLARFRCNVFLDRKGMGGVFRVIPSRILSAEQLGLPKAVLDLCRLPKGLVLVTGPTGSGKSTTLAAMVDFINRHRSEHIITIEDPIEFVHENRRCLINQREVGSHTEGFKTALRAALREDPDVVLVGEMRDLETVSIALETAETGHLVFATLHTNTAPSTVDRVIDQFPADQQAQIRVMLAESLKGVIAQTLCKRKGGGRVAALEILLVNTAVSNLIREAKTFQIPSMMQAGRSSGMVTLNDALIELVRAGVVEIGEAYAKAISKAEFRAACTRAGVPVEKLPG